MCYRVRTAAASWYWNWTCSISGSDSDVSLSITQHSSLSRNKFIVNISTFNTMITFFFFFKGTVLLNLRALLRASTVTNLLIVRLLRVESAVDRLKKVIEVREIVQPVCPPRSNVIKPCSGHSCLEQSVHRTTQRRLPFENLNNPRFCEKWKKSNKRDYT